MSQVEITIDGQKVRTKEGRKILWAALDAGIYIPHLCACREIQYHPGSCRLCLVEIEGRPGLVTSCTEPVAAGMAVRTRSPEIDRVVATGFELLMSTHRLNCGECPGNKRCALQKLSRERKLPLKPKRLKKIEPDRPIDDSHPEFGLDPNHCILCGRCVYVCNEIEKERILDFIRRGLSTVVGTFDGETLAAHACRACLNCVKVCPTGALFFKDPDRADYANCDQPRPAKADGG